MTKEFPNDPMTNVPAGCSFELGDSLVIMVYGLGFCRCLGHHSPLLIGRVLLR
jgi:hypothetical protein